MWLLSELRVTRGDMVTQVRAGHSLHHDFVLYEDKSKHSELDLAGFLFAGGCIHLFRAERNEKSLGKKKQMLHNRIRICLLDES